MLKKLKSMDGAELLSKDEQKEVSGGKFGWPCSPENWTCNTTDDCCEGLACSNRRCRWA
jgi:hypothetical protein